MPSERSASGSLRFGGVDLGSIVTRVGTPAYVYDLDGIAAGARELHAAFDGAPHLVAYAVKANTAGGVVRTLAQEGCGADVVSGAELLVALACGIDPQRIVYSGVAKQNDEIDRAIAHGIGALQIESIEEVARIEARARAVGKTARVGIRVNPLVDLEGATHAKVATGHDAAKFGVRLDDAPTAVELVEASPVLALVGMGGHIGSQFTSVEPYVAGARVLCDLVGSLRDAGRLRSLAFVDTGGGFGVQYARARGEHVPSSPPSPAAFVAAARRELRARRLDHLVHVVEPGRWLVAPHGLLLARVVQPKVTARARWLMIDAGMNDLLRPALYQASHVIVPLESSESEDRWVAWRVAGPVCESSDDFGEHPLPSTPPTAVAILDAGAYGYTMASRYNGRQLPAEVFLRSGSIASRTERTTTESWVDDRVRAG